MPDKDMKLRCCVNCVFWNRPNFHDISGKCLKLSVKEDETYPKHLEEKGITAWPICQHDGEAISYETKWWFECIHFEREK